jgi:hypothetical protein
MPESQRAVRLQRAPLPVDDGDQVLSIPEWCALNNIGLRTGRRILSAGEGPPVIHLSAKRRGITRRDNRIWQESRARGGARIGETRKSRAAKTSSATTTK